MARKVVQIHNKEAVIIQRLLAESDSIAERLSVAVNMVLARHDLVGVFVGLEGNEVFVDVPDIPTPPGVAAALDDSKRDRGISLVSDSAAPDTPEAGRKADSPAEGNPGAGRGPTDAVTLPAPPSQERQRSGFHSEG